MTDLQNQDRLLNGVLRDLIIVTDDIGDRKDQAAANVRAVDDVAVDPWRLELSADYKKSVAFLNGVKKQARELTEDIKRHISEYDSVND